MHKNTLLNDFLMLMTAIIWGLAFVAQRVGMEYLGPFMFNGIRFGLGALSLIVVILLSSIIRGLKNPKTKRTAVQDRKILLIGGIVSGLCLFLGSTFQQVGIIYTTAGNAGFVTGLYVVFVPFIGMFFGQRSGRSRWIGVMLAAVGLYLLSVNERFIINPGDGLVVISSLFWALHMLSISHYSPRTDPLRLSVVQYCVCAALSLIVGLVFETTTVSAVLNAGIPILYGGIMSVGVAYTLQTIAQKKAHPAHAAIILSLEGAFAALGGWLIIGETMSLRGILGCLCMLGGVLAAQWAVIADSVKKRKVLI